MQVDDSRSVFPGESPATSPYAFRAAESDELGRAASLCTPAPARPGEGRQHCFVAVRSQPVERILGVAFWKSIPETDGTLTAELQWTALPALGAELPAFLRALIAHIPTAEPSISTIAIADWLPAEQPSALLADLGFTATATRTHYQADAATWRTALSHSIEETPAIHPPHGEHFPALRPLLCGSSLRPTELAHGFQTAATHQPSLFDPRCSGVVVENGQPTAVCLAQHAHGHLTIAALHGSPAACHALLHHALQAHDLLPEPTTLSYYLDASDESSALAALPESLPRSAATQLSRYTQTNLPERELTKKTQT